VFQGVPHVDNIYQKVE
jgi:hypothetical protein